MCQARFVLSEESKVIFINEKKNKTKLKFNEPEIHANPRENKLPEYLIRLIVGIQISNQRINRDEVKKERKREGYKER